MVAKSISNYVGEEDVNKDKGTWAYDVGGSNAKCKACEGKPFCYKKGKDAFIQHSKTEKHKVNMRRLSSKKKQVNFAAAFGKGTEEKILTKKVKTLEIDITRRLDSHNVPPTIIVYCMKTHLIGEDASKLISGMKLSKTKAVYLSKQGIAKTFLNETISTLLSCDGFCIGFDESEMNKNHECEVMVMLSLADTGIELRHYRTLSLDGTDAKTITRSLLDQMDEDHVPWRQKLISPMTDGCNTMSGCNSGVKKRLEGLKDLGASNDHHLGNDAQKGCEAFDGDIKEALVHIYFDLGGAKGKGLIWEH